VVTTAELRTGKGVPILVGIRGWVAGERYVLHQDESVVIGRSRSCDISLRRIGSYLERPPGERDADQDFNTVSRKHMKLTVSDGQVQIEDLSTNGSYCNGEIIGDPREVDLRQSQVEIRLGTREAFKLELVGEAEAQAILDGKQAAPQSDEPDDDSELEEP